MEQPFWFCAVAVLVLCLEKTVGSVKDYGYDLERAKQKETLELRA